MGRGKAGRDHRQGAHDHDRDLANRTRGPSRHGPAPGRDLIPALHVPGLGLTLPRGRAQVVLVRTAAEVHRVLHAVHRDQRAHQEQ